ncbi:unnamed protein product [Dovyalis caffra]|uniref:Histone deacetylase complex subunit SAP18 n=1 Tax=Dovyalis caffra TaxID=77055 RepID=A0AAV1RF66_9ROSI|nr:unnamed protein product [Dovyalis caffra]
MWATNEEKSVSERALMEKKGSRDREGDMGGGAAHNRPLHPPSRAYPTPPPPRLHLEPIDREKTCPLLLRVFTKIGSHHKLEDFVVRGKEPKDEVQIYTWKDATLRELTDLVKEVAPEARRRNAKLSFAFVYPDKHGRFVLRVVGMTHSSGRRPDDLKALAELNFQIGDYLDVAIITQTVGSWRQENGLTNENMRYLLDFGMDNWNQLLVVVIPPKVVQLYFWLECSGYSLGD